MRYLNNWIWLFAVVVGVVIFFTPFWIWGKLPFPADALVGLYHPFRDKFNQYPRGYPYKNPLITDPVRQQYPYRELAISRLKDGILPKWNPYNFAGTPLLANIQTAAIYPLNFVYWLFPFQSGWTLQVVFQPLLAGIFMFLYLRNLQLEQRACYLGAISFAFSGFMVAWLTWNTVSQVALWMPLILLATDKLLQRFSYKWELILIIAESSMLLAGHLQTALYVVGFTIIYLMVRVYQLYDSKVDQLGKKLLVFIFTGGIVLTLTSIQLIPTYKFILESARSLDLSDWQRPDWFIPWQHLIQFIAPDFFGNPATGNYWGVWNYGEFIGFIGIIPLTFAILAICYRRNKKTFFYSSLLIISLIMALPTLLAKLPYMIKVAFISTLQPSRILVIIDFCLAVLAAFGLDYFLKNIDHKRVFKQILIVLAGMGILLISIWGVLLTPQTFGVTSLIVNNFAISKKNLLLPTVLLGGLTAYMFINKFAFRKKLFEATTVFLLFIVTFDLLHFGWKFTPFSDLELLFPSTQVINFLQENLGVHRFMTTDRRLLPPNVSTYYRIQSVDGYDPLYLRNYGELVAAWTRERPDVTPGAFNRILTPEKTQVFIKDLLGVKYVISIQDISDRNLKLVLREGETRVFENIAVYPRAFLVASVEAGLTRDQIIESMFREKSQLLTKAFTDVKVPVKSQPLSDKETVVIEKYSEDFISITVSAATQRLLVLTDIYYPEWKAFINGQLTPIVQVDLSLRGVIVLHGKSLVEFKI